MVEQASLGVDKQRDALIGRMTEAADAFLASLSPAQRAKAAFAFPAEAERRRWYYTPTEQGGLPLVEMDATQQRLAQRVVASGLSLPGYAVASTIMGLENVLDAEEGWCGSYQGRAQPNRGRDPNLYFLSVFGAPGTRGSWGWRFGGHHISLNYTIADGHLASPTPIFFGAHPAETPLVGPGTLRPLAGEEDLGRELLLSLDDDQQAVALLAPVAPFDITQSNRPRIEDGALSLPFPAIFAGDVPASAAARLNSAEARYAAAHGLQPEHLAAIRYSASPKGLPVAKLTTRQRELFTALLQQYTGRLPDAAADAELARLAGSSAEALHFAWAGGSRHGEPHYYRIQGPRLLIEYDNTQNDVNHIHSVWRDPEGDFGADLLAQHYADAH